MRLTSERLVPAFMLTAGLLTVPSPVYADYPTNASTSSTSSMVFADDTWTRPISYGVESLPLLQRTARATAAELRLQTALIKLAQDSTSESANTYLAQLEQLLPDDAELQRYRELLAQEQYQHLNDAISTFHARLAEVRASFLSSTNDFREWLAAARLMTPGEALQVPSRFVQTGPRRANHELDLDQIAFSSRLSATLERQVR